MTRIALSAGHHNSSGGDAREIRLVGPVTRALAQACRERGFDVRVITPQEGIGTYPGRLDQAAAKVLEWAAAGWKADLFLEIHGEANGSGNAGRGCFAIYPDWGKDIDSVVRDRLGPQLASAITSATGIPKRTGGVMSEKKTGVGLQGYRLGVFRVTESVRTFCARLILEIGSYTAPADVTIMNAPGFPERIASGLADALANFYGLAPQLPSALDVQVLGVAPSITPAQFVGALKRHDAPLSLDEMERVYRFCVWLDVDPAFIIALWKAEGGSPLGSSVLQQQTRQPINIKAAAGEWRPTVAYNNALWHRSESFQLGLLGAILHVKNIHGAAGRLTVREILPVHAPPSENETELLIGKVLEDMRYMAAQPGWHP